MSDRLEAAYEALRPAALPRAAHRKEDEMKVEIIADSFGTAMIGVSISKSIRYLLTIEEAEKLSHQIQAQLSDARAYERKARYTT